MKASDWLVQREYAARRQGSFLGLIAGCIVGVSIMLGIHVALSMHADSIHESAVASIREADAVLMRECEGIVRDIAEEEYVVVRDYRRQIDELQKGVRPP